MHASVAQWRALVAPLVVVLALAAPPWAHAAAHPGRPARPTPLVDANIEAIVLADNDGEIALGSLAQGTAADAGVKAMARRMVADHNMANERTRALALRLGLHPVHNPTSRGLVRSAETTQAQLATLRGDAFDRAYLESAVARHQEMLALFDQKLIPAAQSLELRNLLASLRPQVASHLARAKGLRARLTN